LIDCLMQRPGIWYAGKAVEHGWSGNLLALQIQAGLHERQGRAVTNFRTTLPPAQSDLAQSITKDPYLFDFLALDADSGERAVETGLVAQVEKFLLELGAGFALVGRQVHLEIGGKDFYLDLLFYHLKLRCYLVIDLKTREFTPEAAGKMNFYLSAVDDRFKQADDQPSIGLILCRDKNRVIAEYALRDLNKPIGVSGYLTQLVDTLHKSLAGAVPTVAELRRGLAPRRSARAFLFRRRKSRRQVALAAFDENLQELGEGLGARDAALGGNLIGAFQQLLRHRRGLLR
jgi:predicted nuclease of restriction endonuclease-like (RecB) superfamily